MSKMFPHEIKLIQTVRAYECIYNNRIYEYKNVLTKQTAWAEISRKMNRSVPECKQKWSQLRNAYLHALIRRKSASNLKKWKYEDEMRFLLPFMGYGLNDTTSSPEINNQDNDSSGSQNTYEHSNGEHTPDRNKRKVNHQEYVLEIKEKRQRVEEGMINVPPSILILQNMLPNCPEDMSEDELNVNHTQETIQAKYQKDSTENEDMFHTTHAADIKKEYENYGSPKYEEDAREAEINKIKPRKVDFHEEMLHIIKDKIQRKKVDKDEIDLLFESLAVAVKKLPKTEQVKVKIGVTNLVYEAQMRCESQ